MQTDTASPALAILAVDVADSASAIELSQRLGLPLLPAGSGASQCTVYTALLLPRGKTLSLQLTGAAAPGPVSVDFGSAGMRHRRRSGNNELLGRAVGVGKKPALHILDATAGLGRDSFVLADLGCRVDLCERAPVVLELLRAGLTIANVSEDPWLREVAARMRLLPGDVREVFPAHSNPPDVIYLDPMFAQREKSAAVKKEMALFQLLLAQQSVPTDAEDVLAWALQQAVARVVVKRPAKAPELGGLQPSHCIRGKAVRYDCYVRRALA